VADAHRIVEQRQRIARRLYALKPAVTRIDVGVNLADTAQNTVVQTAAQAALAAAPAALRERVRVQKCEAPGAEMSAGFELYAAPVELLSIWREFKNSRSAREFRRRLKRKPKPQKRAPREVSTA
jgi:elongation factor P--beta-lysine ligase